MPVTAADAAALAAYSAAWRRAVVVARLRALWTAWAAQITAGRDTRLNIVRPPAPPARLAAADGELLAREAASRPLSRQSSEW